MSPALLLAILVACLLALLPVWRLRHAGWPARWLFVAWLGYALAILLLIGFPGPLRFLAPVLVLAYLAPFVAGPERLTRVLGGRAAPERPVVDVTPRPLPPLPGPHDADDEGTDPR
jgi:hypothetical protein